jgi:hypothetical protein
MTIRLGCEPLTSISAQLFAFMPPFTDSLPLQGYSSVVWLGGTTKQFHAATGTPIPGFWVGMVEIKL